MKNTKVLKILAPLALLGAALIWGGAFVVVKQSVDEIPPLYMMAFRFSIAAAFLALIFIGSLKRINAKMWIHGAITGALVFLAYATQTYGAKYTTAGNNAFLTALYVVLVPLFAALLARKKPDLLDVCCAVVAVIGIGCMCLSAFSVNVGDLLTICCSFFFAAHIIALSKFTKTDDVGALTMLQFLFAAAFSWLFAPIAGEKFPAVVTDVTKVVTSMLFLGIVSSGIAFLFQSFGQKHTNAAAGAVLLSTESVFGALFGWIILSEHMSAVSVLGGALLLLAIIAGQTRLSFIPPLGKFFAADTDERESCSDGAPSEQEKNQSCEK